MGVMSPSDLSLGAVEEDIDKYKDLLRNLSFEKFIRDVYKRAWDSIEGEEPGLVMWKSQESFPARLANNIANNKRTVTIGPRVHMKSSILGAYTLYRILKAENDFDIRWFHYQQKKAGEQIQKKIIRVREESPFLRSMLKDQTKRAKTKMEVQNNIFGSLCKIIPMGLNTSVRSIHADIVIADDILKVKATSEGESTGTPKEVRQAGERFKTSVALGTKTKKEHSGEIHLVGTAMAKQDILHEYLEKKNWKGLKTPAVIDPVFNKKENKIIDYERLAFPELYGLEDINKFLSDLGLRAFKKEMLCEPSSEIDAFLNLEKLRRLFDYDPSDRPPVQTYVGGHDIGKKSNPAHSYIFGISDTGEMWEIESQWMWGVDYTDQIQWWKDKCTDYRNRGVPISLAYYDNTRSEFEAVAEQGLLPDEFKPQPLNQQRWAIAQQLEERVFQETIHFKGSKKDFQQLASMDEHLNAPEQHGEAHADNFWAAAFSAYAASQVLGSEKQIIEPGDLSPQKLKKESRWKSPQRTNSGSRWKMP